ncbi:MAG: iron-sulfur cluster assembly scaffold protein [Promethearchaeota archaeon]
MSDDQFNKFVDKLEREIIETEIKDHNKYIVDLFRNPQNWGKPPKEKYNFFQECWGNKGEVLQLFLNINKEGIIEEAYFLTDGCGCMIATGSQTTIIIKGKSVEFAENLKSSDLDKALKGLPKHEMYCAELAIKALKSIIKSYKESLY